MDIPGQLDRVFRALDYVKQCRARVYGKLRFAADLPGNAQRSA